MRVALLTTSYPTHPGDPSGHFVAAEGRALVEQGHEVVVIAPGRSSRTAPGPPTVMYRAGGDAFGWPGVLSRLRERPLRSLSVARFLLRARRALAEAGPFDRVVAHWLVPCGFPLGVSVPRGVALEVVAHGSDVRLLESLPRAAVRAITSALLARRTTVRCVSHELAARLSELDARFGDDLLVEPSRLEIPLCDRAAARARVHGRAPPLVLIVARLVSGKRAHVSLAAARLISEARVVVIGDGPLRGELERAFPQAEFLGQLARERCLDWIAAADVLLCASELEGAPTVVRESRALGTPVVAVRAGDLEHWASRDPGLYVLAR